MHIKNGSVRLYGWVSMCVILAVLVCAAAPWAGAQEVKNISLTEGEMQVVAVPFVIKSYKLADPNLAQVELFDKQNLRIVGVKSGSTDLQVTGDGNAFATFTISVVENIKAVLDAMRRDLDEVPEVDLSVSLGRVVVRGEINSVQHWDLLQKVVVLYGDQVANLVTFRPAPEVLLALKQDMEKAGFKVVERDSAEARQPGVLTIEVSGNNIFIAGQVYSRADMATIEDVLAAQRWLVVKKGDEEIKDDKIYGIVKVGVIPSLIELDVAFMNVTDEEEKQVGINLVKQGLLAVDATALAFKGNIGQNEDTTSGFQGSYYVNAGLAGTLKFYAGSGPGRRQTTGHMTFKNDAPDWQSYHSGGTLKIRVTSQEEASLEDVEYGFIMKAKGGMINSEMVQLDLDLELSFPIPIGQDYDVKTEHLASTINCPLSKTLVMGGIKDLSEKVSKEGVPFLRSVPVLSFLFSEENQVVQDRKVLILVCPSLNTSTLQGTRYSDETVKTLDESGKPVKEMEKQRRDEQKEKEGVKRFF